MQHCTVLFLLSSNTSSRYLMPWGGGSGMCAGMGGQGAQANDVIQFNRGHSLCQYNNVKLPWTSQPFGGNRATPVAQLRTWITRRRWVLLTRRWGEIRWHLKIGGGGGTTPQKTGWKMSFHDIFVLATSFPLVIHSRQLSLRCEWLSRDTSQKMMGREISPLIYPSPHLFFPLQTPLLPPFLPLFILLLTSIPFSRDVPSWCCERILSWKKQEIVL
jgi:hypothetical protein